MPRVAVASDAFTNTDGTALTAHGGGNWLAVVEQAGSVNARVVGNQVVAQLSSGIPDFPAYRWNGAGAFTDDQYAQAVVQSLTWQTAAYRAGVAVRMSADTGAAADYYAWWVVDDSNTSRTTVLAKIVNGFPTTLDTRTVAWVSGDTMILEAVGTALNCYRNGTLLFSITDTALTTGKPGLVLKGGSNVPALDDWVGGNVTAGGDTTPPVITGPGGATGSTATATITAPATVVHTYTANESVTWSLNGGANVGLFAINSSTGALTFGSASAAGSYVVGVRATDAASNATTQTLTVTVNAASGDTTPPVITGPGGATGSTATATITAPATVVHTYTANESVTWSLNGGANVGLFAINSSTGALTFGSASAAGSYVVGVRATDAASNATTQTLTVTVNAASGDTTPPTLTGSITQGATTSSSIAVTCPAGADNVAVTAYEFSRDGGSTWASSATPSYAFTGLTASTAYAIRARAKDAAGNVSTPALAASFSTSDAVVTPPPSGSVLAGPFFNNTLASRWRSTPVSWTWWAGSTQRVGALTATPAHGVGTLTSDGMLTPGVSGEGVLMVAVLHTDATDDDTYYQAF